MSDRIYISSRYSPEQTVWITSSLLHHEFTPSERCVYTSVGAFITTLAPGDRVVVHSLSTFDGSMELLAGLRLIFERGATIYSVREFRLVDKLTVSLVETLFATAVNGLLGHSAEVFKRLDPSTLELLVRMERLIQQQGLTVSKASRLSGCSRNIYYYYKRLIR